MQASPGFYEEETRETPEGSWPGPWLGEELVKGKQTVKRLQYAKHSANPLTNTFSPNPHQDPHS